MTDSRLVLLSIKSCSWLPHMNRHEGGKEWRIRTQEYLTNIYIDLIFIRRKRWMYIWGDSYSFPNQELERSGKKKDREKESLGSSRLGCHRLIKKPPGNGYPSSLIPSWCIKIQNIQLSRSWNIQFLKKYKVTFGYKSIYFFLPFDRCYFLFSWNTIDVVREWGI